LEELALLKKRNIIAKLATFLMMLAPTATFIWGCTFLIGEPQLPRKMLKEDEQI